MKINLPVSQREVPVDAQANILSTTDLKGALTYANDDFVAICGFSRDELLGREGWKEKSVDNLFAAIEAKRTPDAGRLLFGLGIRHIGAVTARDLLKGLGEIALLPEKAAEIQAYVDANPQAEGESGGGGEDSEQLVEFHVLSPSFDV